MKWLQLQPEFALWLISKSGSKIKVVQRVLKLSQGVIGGLKCCFWFSCCYFWLVNPLLYVFCINSGLILWFFILVVVVVVAAIFYVGYVS